MRNIVIVGGGTAGWMAAAALSKFCAPEQYSITLVESEAIGTVGVGEATIPHLRFFNEKLGINENEFMRVTQATYKLGIEFVNWGKLGDAYIHPFGDFGLPLNDVEFYHYWLMANISKPQRPLFDYSLAVRAAHNGRFAHPRETANPLTGTYSYAFHIDASLYAKYLMGFCVERGVNRIEGKIQQVLRDPTTGNITALCLEDGSQLNGDLFIDCSGFRSLLLGDALGVPFEDWRKWLPCDRAIAVPTVSEGQPRPYTRAVAHAAGWQWQIPLRHRDGNGHVYASEFMSQEDAQAILLANLKGEPLAKFNRLKFVAGRRSQTWSHNCVAVGLSSGFLEPLESTSIYLIQLAIMKLVELLPAVDDYTASRAEFNRQLSHEYERVRDFLILHYHVTEREDSAFWRYCKHMEVPSSLADRIALFKEIGNLDAYHQGLFLSPSWVAVMIGQGCLPQLNNVKLEGLGMPGLEVAMSKMQAEVERIALQMPSHQQALGKVADTEAGDWQWPAAAMSLYGVFS